jgi:DNA-binding transcriptional LysR family regulator
MADQNRSSIDWEDIRVFIALARHGSMTAAARALSVNHATVTRRVAALEERLGVKLVERRPNGYVLTPDGVRTLASAHEMETAAASLARSHEAAGPTGLVRVNAPPSLSHDVIVPHLASFAAEHPGLDIEVVADVRPVSLERHETDIALRFGRPLDGDFIARHLITVAYGFYASRAWHARVANGDDPVFVGFDEATTHIPDASWLVQQFPKARISFRASTQSAQATAAKCGAGIALLPHFIGRADPDLHPCLTDIAPPSRELWMLIRKGDRTGAAVRATTKVIEQIFVSEHARFG